MNTTTLTRRIPMVVVTALAGATTLWFVAEVAQPSEPPPRAAVEPSDESFNWNEHRRHLALVQDRADGFDVAEAARFDRIEARPSEPVDPTGFDKAEQARHLRQAPK